MNKALHIAHTSWKIIRLIIVLNIFPFFQSCDDQVGSRHTIGYPLIYNDFYSDENPVYGELNKILGLSNDYSFEIPEGSISILIQNGLIITALALLLLWKFPSYARALLHIVVVIVLLLLAAISYISGFDCLLLVIYIPLMLILPEGLMEIVPNIVFSIILGVNVSIAGYLFSESEKNKSVQLEKISSV